MFPPELLVSCSLYGQSREKGIFRGNSPDPFYILILRWSLFFFFRGVLLSPRPSSTTSSQTAFALSLFLSLPVRAELLTSSPNSSAGPKRNNPCTSRADNTALASAPGISVPSQRTSSPTQPQGVLQTHREPLFLHQRTCKGTCQEDTSRQAHSQGRKLSPWGI